MWFSIALASPSTVVHVAALAERTELGAVDVDGKQLSLAIGPCNKDTCPVTVGHGASRAEVLELGGVEDSTNKFEYTEMGSGWDLTLGERTTPTVEIRPYPGLLTTPTVMFHAVVGYEHLSDRWALVTVADGKAKLVWSKHPAPRDVGSTLLERVDVDGKPTLVFHQHLPQYTQSDTHETVRTTGWQVHDGELTELETVPTWLVIAATEKNAPSAFEKRGAKKCLAEFSVLSTDDFPRLKPGLTVLGRVAPTKQVAEEWLGEALGCAPDAYVKRGR